MYTQTGGQHAVELLQNINLCELRIFIQAEVYREDTSQAKTTPGLWADTPLHTGQVLLP